MFLMSSPDDAAARPAGPAPATGPAAADAAREAFLALAAHELRTPLTALKGYSQLLVSELRQPAPDLARLAYLADRLVEVIGRHEQLVADLLTAAALRETRLPLRPEALDLVELAREALARCEAAPERRPEHILVLEAPAAAPLIGDRDRLDQLLTELLDNAVRYSPASGQIRLCIRQRDGGVELALSDAGPGIRPELHATLFQPFARTTPPRGAIRGLGLGLYRAAQIVERHYGTIALQSQPGAGTTVTVWLPLVPRATLAAPPRRRAAAPPEPPGAQDAAGEE